MLKFGVIGTSKKQNEQRVPIHPDHFDRIPESLRKLLTFEQGYGAPFDITDAERAQLDAIGACVLSVILIDWRRPRC